MNSVEFNRYVLYMCVNILTESRKNKKLYTKRVLSITKKEHNNSHLRNRRNG